MLFTTDERENKTFNPAKKGMPDQLLISLKLPSVVITKSIRLKSSKHTRIVDLKLSEDWLNVYISPRDFSHSVVGKKLSSFPF